MAALVFVLALAHASLAQNSSAAPAAVVAYSWTGFYVGGHAGPAWGLDAGSSMQTLTQVPTITDPISFDGQTNMGAVGGFQAGYNFQLNPSWVVGIEGDWSWASLGEQSRSFLTSLGATLPLGNSVAMQAQLNWVASVRGRVGYAWDRVLIYGTGGLAWADMSFGAYRTYNAVAPNNFGSVRGASLGWVAGGGIEYATTKHLIVRAEYLYYSLDSDESVRTVCSGIGVCGATPPVNVYSWGDATVQTARIALSYKF
jgi:outer membrane immunogenic protein